ncbi:MAG: TonB-dependent receptor [Sphingomonadales bacterium]|nr:MAG: TonB-dependent receptor [Sphingomonadales bacterium]TNF03413.1 MAG: TonB-dependent receptor [Sphingomonadales bacterium]
MAEYYASTASPMRAIIPYGQEQGIIMLFSKVRSFAKYSCAISAFVAPIAVYAQESQSKYFDIPSQALPNALNIYARQAGIQIFFPSERIADIRSVPIKGELTREEALHRLIAGTGLEVASRSGGTVMLRFGRRQASTIGASGPNGTSAVIPNEEIVVTGSRIARTAQESSTPISMLGRDEIESSGTIMLEDILTRQPQFAGGQTSRSNNPGTGAAQIDLRGLGTARNLVLVNGRRYIFFGADQVTDINTIPAALVDRVEVVTGGSSAVYGSDAIAGVTNFILRTDFEGIEGRFQTGGATRGDAMSRSADVTWGSNFAGGRGNIVLSGNYYERDGVRQSARGYSNYALTDGTDGAGNPVLTARGSLQSPDGSFSGIPYGAQLDAPEMAGLKSALSAAGLSGIGSAGFTFDGAGSAARPFADPADRYNFAPLNYLVIPAKRYGLSGFGHFDLSDAVTAYTEFAYFHSEVDMQLAESNLSTTLAVEVDNPYVSPALQQVFHQLDLLETGAGQNDGLVNLRIARRFQEFGARQALVRRDSYRAGGGLKGSLPDVSASFLRDNRFDISYFYGQADSVTELNNLVSRSKLMAGVLSSNGADPLVNLFGAGGISQEAVAQLAIDTSNPSTSRQHIASANFSSNVLSLPAGPLGGALGFEWRSAYADSYPDDALASGDGVGFDSYLPTKGKVNVYEIFGELRAPILSRQSPIGALTANGAFRYSHYDISGASNVWTYLGGLEWSPVRDLLFRGQWQHAVRAPNIYELFGGQAADRPRASDPCAQPAAATDTVLRDLCIATGVPVNLVGDSALQSGDRLDVLYGGNPDLTVETSDTYSFGVTITPHFIPNLTLTADYFNIRIKDAIAPLAGGVTSIFNLCYSVIQDAQSAVCKAVRRNPADGRIEAPYSVLALNTNIGRLETSGIDFGLAWKKRLGFGLAGGESMLTIDARGTWLESYSITPVQDLPDEVSKCAGAFGLTCGDPHPRLKTVSRISWNSGPLTLKVQHRHLSAVTDDRIVIPRRLGMSGPSKADLAAPVMAARDYIDLSFSLDIPGRKMTLYGGVNNLFDLNPPIVGYSQQQANTYPSTYDALGAEFFVGAKVRF